MTSAGAGDVGGGRARRPPSLAQFLALLAPALLALPAALAAAGLLALGWFPLRALAADYQDSPPGFYLAIGGGLWALAIVLLAALAPLVRPRSPWPWLALSMAALAATVAPYGLPFSNRADPIEGLADYAYVGWAYFLGDESGLFPDTVGYLVQPLLAAGAALALFAATYARRVRAGIPAVATAAVASAIGVVLLAYGGDEMRAAVGALLSGDWD